MLQWIVVSICISSAIFGATFATIGAIREAAPNSPGNGLVMIVVGTVALGFSGIGISLASKLLHKDK